MKLELPKTLNFNFLEKKKKKKNIFPSFTGGLLDLQK